ncbi:hypothetical protein GV794_18205 [Nocardia cyriacigeorgica]|uniref:RelA/SpoT domain-containing protein n=1 Tax=Nocardia cyriacigeorgica TaxID=135487 RepID=A0ABX0CM27_9NOCA|nr:hypothetical protein [Nocardia cyriacigeorgica]
MITVRVDLASGRNVPPQDLRQFMESVERSVDRTFNTEQSLLNGDALLVDVVYTTDPAAAHLHLTVDNNRENLSAITPHSNTDIATNQIRHQLGLPTVPIDGNPTLTQDDLRQISDDIAASSTPTRLGNPSELRRFGTTELQPVERIEYQTAVQDSLREGDGFRIGADPRTHPYGQLINDGGPTVAGRGNNCLDCSLSALSSFFGNPQVSAPRWPDRVPNGTIDESTGEFNGLSRAERWLGGGLLSYYDGQRSVPDQFASMHSWVSQLGPGSAALVVNAWHAWNPETQQYEYNADGTARSGSTHATVIVYPHGAAGPVWWDPQSGEMTDHPPTHMANTSVDVWFTPIPADQGVNYDAGAVSNQGTGPAVPGTDLRPQPELSDRSDRARLVVQSATGPGPNVQPDGRNDEFGGQRRDRSSAQIPELAGTEDRRGLHTSAPHRTTTNSAPNLPTANSHQYPSHQRDHQPDRVPDNGTRRTEAAPRLPAHGQQTNTGIPANRDDLRSRDFMAGLAQGPGRDLAGNGNDRVLTATDDRSVDTRGNNPRSAAEGLPQQELPPLGNFIPIGPEGPNNAGTSGNAGTSPAVPGPSAQHHPPVHGSPDSVRLGVPSNTDAGGTNEGQGPRAGELRGQPSDRSRDGAPQPVATDDRTAVRRSDSDRATGVGTPGVPTDLTGTNRPDSGDSRRDPVPSPGRITDAATDGTSDATPSHDRQTQPPAPYEHPGNPSHLQQSDGLGRSPEPPEGSVASERDVRVLDGPDREPMAAPPRDSGRDLAGSGENRVPAPESRTTAQNAQAPVTATDHSGGGAARTSDQMAGQDRNGTTGLSSPSAPIPEGRAGSPTPGSPSADPSQPSAAPAHSFEVPRRTLDDVRPFEQPGGLRPVEPEFQQAVESAVPRRPDGEPLVHPPVNHSWVDEINDGGPWADSGRGINCVDATRAGLSTFYGDPQAAAARMLETDEFGRPDWAGEIDGISNMEEWAGARYSHTGTGEDGLDEAMQRVADAGPGATAAVLVDWAPADPPEIDPDTGLPCDPGSHQLALINDNGRLLWVDFQTRTITDYFPFSDGVGDVWAITMDADRNPVVDPDQDYSDPVTETPEGQPKRPTGSETEDGGPENPDPASGDTSLPPLLSAEEYLTQPHVVEALRHADEQGTTTVVDGAEMPIGQAVRQLLPQHPELAALLQETDYLEKSLLARPKTLASLMNHPEAIPVLADAAHEVRDRGADEILADNESASGPEPTPLTAEQRTISEVLRTSTEDYLETDRRQPDFDVSRMEDREYRSQYLDRQYAQWQATQEALNDVVREVAEETNGQPGWRREPKDRVRAEDKIAGYQGNASRLTDLVGAKIVFDSVADIYRAAGLLAHDERIEIVDFDDRFNEPVGSGYRDLQMKVRMPNGHIAELRLHLSHIDEVADYEHALYEGRRDLKALAESEGRDPTPNESALKAALERRSVEMFQMALERGLQ